MTEPMTELPKMTAALSPARVDVSANVGRGGVFAQLPQKTKISIQKKGVEVTYDVVKEMGG